MKANEIAQPRFIIKIFDPKPGDAEKAKIVLENWQTNFELVDLEDKL